MRESLAPAAVRPRLVRWEGVSPGDGDAHLSGFYAAVACAGCAGQASAWPPGRCSPRRGRSLTVGEPSGLAGLLATSCGWPALVPAGGAVGVPVADAGGVPGGRAGRPGHAQQGDRVAAVRGPAHGGDPPHPPVRGALDRVARRARRRACPVGPNGRKDRGRGHDARAPGWRSRSPHGGDREARNTTSHDHGRTEVLPDWASPVAGLSAEQ